MANIARARSSSACEAVIEDVNLVDRASRTAQAVESVLGGMSIRKAEKVYQVDRRTIKR